MIDGRPPKSEAVQLVRLSVIRIDLSASRPFVIAEDPGGEKIFCDEANKGVTDFEGFVGANNSKAE